MRYAGYKNWTLNPNLTGRSSSKSKLVNHFSANKTVDEGTVPSMVFMNRRKSKVSQYKTFLVSNSDLSSSNKGYIGYAHRDIENLICVHRQSPTAFMKSEQPKSDPRHI